MATCDTASLFANASCFTCLTPGEWQVLELQLLCEILGALGGSTGGGGGGGGLVGLSCAAGAPTSTPSSTCALYIDINTGTLYEWYNNAWH